MKLTLADAKLFVDAVSIISEIVTEASFTVTSEAMGLVALDPATVAMIDFKIVSSAFAEYEVKDTEELAINLTNLKQVLRRAGSTDSLTLETDDGQLKITLQGVSKRTFHLPLIEYEGSRRSAPNIQYAATITTISSQFSAAVDDASIVAESVALLAQEGSFSIVAEGDLSKAAIEIPQSAGTKIVVAESVSSGEETEQVVQPVKSRYSVEYLKKMVQGAKISANVMLQFRKDHPLRLEYKVLNKMQLAFILAPRVENE